jgi:hypothetical protein
MVAWAAKYECNSIWTLKLYNEVRVQGFRQMQQIQLQLRAAENRSLCNPKLGAFKKRKKEKKKRLHTFRAFPFPFAIFQSLYMVVNTPQIYPWRLNDFRRIFGRCMYSCWPTHKLWKLAVFSSYSSVNFLNMVIHILFKSCGSYAYAPCLATVLD